MEKSWNCVFLISVGTLNLYVSVVFPGRTYIYFFMVKDVDHPYLLASVKSSHSGQLTRTKKSVSLRNSSKYPTNITDWHSEHVACNVNKNLAVRNNFRYPRNSISLLGVAIKAFKN